jgi:chromosome segregation ATPase
MIAIAAKISANDQLKTNNDYHKILLDQISEKNSFISKLEEKVAFLQSNTSQADEILKINNEQIKDLSIEIDEKNNYICDLETKIKKLECSVETPRLNLSVETINNQN